MEVLQQKLSKNVIKKKKTYFIQFSLSYVEEVLTSIGFASQNNVSNFQVIREVKI